ncbi:MAG: hypothetical protein K2N15_04815, partial [Lachnospiraceae bacterium]|nr:hypothetical protein [Lachnospiraceae bacterium]
MNQKVNYIVQFMEYIPRIEQLYKTNLRLHFATYMPLISARGTEIMTAKAELLTKEKINCNYIIEQLIRETRCNKRKYFTRDEQITVLEKLIRAAENKLFLCIDKNSKESLFVLRQMLEYNFLLSAIFIGRNRESISCEKIEEPLFKEIINTLEYYESFKVFNRNVDDANAKINNLLANDKQAIQKAMGYVVSNMPEKVVIKDKKNLEVAFSKEKISEILNSARALYKMLQILDLVLAEKKCIIKVTKTSINIEVKRRYKESSFSQIDKMIENAGREIDETWVKEYDRDIKYDFGLSFSEIEILEEQLLSNIGHNFNNWVFDEENLYKVFSFTSYSKEELSKFCSYFILDKSYKANSAFDSEKSVKKPIIGYGEGIYASSLVMLLVGIRMLLEDIKAGTTANELFNRKVQKVIDRNRRLFEKEVADSIIRLYPESKVLWSVKKIAGVTMPGEIDVMCFFEGIVFIFECKAVDLKYTLKEEQNFVKNFTRDSKNSYVMTLD